MGKENAEIFHARQRAEEFKDARVRREKVKAVAAAAGLRKAEAQGRRELAEEKARGRPDRRPAGRQHRKSEHAERALEGVIPLGRDRQFLRRA